MAPKIKGSLAARVNAVEMEVEDVKLSQAGIKGEFKSLKALIYGLYFPGLGGLAAVVFEAIKFFHGK